MSSADAAREEPLDFHAPVPGEAAVTCVACKQPIADQYWSAGEAVLCELCKTAVEQGQQGAPDVVSRAARFTRAVILGSAAMLLGAGVWYAVARLANLEVGLIAILLGFLVGRAVFIGWAAAAGCVTSCWRYSSPISGSASPMHRSPTRASATACRPKPIRPAAPTAPKRSRSAPRVNSRVTRPLKKRPGSTASSTRPRRPNPKLEPAR